MQIWKYVLTTTDNQTIKMPKGAQILTFQIQNGKPCLWALVNPSLTETERYIEIHGTGNYIEESLLERKYIGTYQLHGGSLVFHVFEIIVP